MLPFEQNESITRMQFTELKFQHQIKKAYRKGKLIEVENGSIEGNNIEKIIVDPALALFNYAITPAGEEDENNRRFFSHLLPARNSDPDSATRCFKLINPPRIPIWDVLKSAETKEIFKLIVDADPTPNKEYVQWVLMMYTRILKDREPRTQFSAPENIMGGESYLFFENLYKVSDALKIFHKIKNSKLLAVDQRDIYTYKSVDDFVETVFSINIGAVTEVNTEVLSAKEWEQVHNKKATIVHQDPEWIIIHTVDAEANSVFGENTTWCTAGTRYSNMFNNYNKQGKLFVLVKNQVGASSHLRTNPENRLQFHFETSQFMNALDRGIDIAKFLSEHQPVKTYFREYVVNEALNKITKVEDIIKSLQRLGMVKELVPILKKLNRKQLDLSGIIGHNDQFELDNIGELVTLEELIIRDCELVSIPESIRSLANLKILRLSGNKIKKIPEWLNEMKNLRILILMKNQIEETFDISGLESLVEINLAFNKGLTKLPLGLSKLHKLLTVDCSSCNIREVDEEILKCDNLVQLNLIRNNSLSKIPLDIVNLPNLLYLGLDATQISTAQRTQMENMKQNPLTVLH